jgi:hypothetical protein
MVLQKNGVQPPVAPDVHALPPDEQGHPIVYLADDHVGHLCVRGVLSYCLVIYINLSLKKINKYENTNFSLPIYNLESENLEGVYRVQIMKR